MLATRFCMLHRFYTEDTDAQRKTMIYVRLQRQYEQTWVLNGGPTLNHWETLTAP